jgi:hypothetical protein
MPIAFVNRDQLRVLQTIAGSSASPRQGSFELTTTSQVSATHSQIKIAPTDRVHEATWKSAIGLLASLNRSTSIVKAPDEADFYDSLCTEAFCAKGVGFDWPSFVRNRANYRAGFAYKLSSNTLGVLRSLQPWRSLEAGNVFRVMRGTYQKSSSDISSFTNHVGMMISVAVALFLIVRELHRELLARRRMDTRWEQKRKHFVQQFMGTGEDFKILSSTG